MPFRAPNLQDLGSCWLKVRAIIDGRIVRVKVSTKAMRNGLITKPVRRKYTKPAAA